MLTRFSKASLARLWGGGVLFGALACLDPAVPNQPLGEDGTDRCPSPSIGVSIGGDAGKQSDAVATPTRRVVLMGGGAEVDSAAILFAEGAGGGDLVVLRTTGSLTSYPTYFTSTLSPQPRPASAVTLLTAIPGTAADPAVLCWIERAEAVWLAGGDQWDYLGRWPDGVHTSLSQLSARGASVGGTSAGAMSLGEGAFDAEFGGVTSAEALSNPLRPDVSVSYPSFSQPELSRTLVDSHFTRRDREGRLLAFLARFLSERGHAEVTGVGLDEGAALVLEGGRYRVWTRGAASVWLYRVKAPVELSAGAPLNLTDIRVVRLENGSSGSWPVEFDSSVGVALSVEDGVVGR